MPSRHVAIGGVVAPGFEGVRSEFERNFAERDELGAAFAVVQDGEMVVDLWGGVADRASGEPWREDTIQTIFSGTKGAVAICALLLVERGLLDLQAPVCDYWPEFAANGKEAIRVRDVVDAHSARLPGVEQPVSVAACADDRHMAELLQAQAPSRDPRARFCYHPLTHGWLCGELVRRIDGRSIGRFFAEEVAAPLGLELWIGLPAEHEPRVATLKLAPDWPASPFLKREALAADALLTSIWANPPILLDRSSFPWNSASYHAAEIPGAGGIGTARSVAKLYAQLDRILSEETIRPATTTLTEGIDEAHGAMRRRLGAGFLLQTAQRPLGPEPDAFGGGGAGGSTHGAWPGRRIGFSYAMNRMRDDQEVDPRAHALLAALHAAISRVTRGSGRRRSR